MPEKDPTTEPPDETLWSNLPPGSATPEAASATRLLFVDVDGVLNTSTMSGGCQVHPKLTRRLAHLVVRCCQQQDNHVCGIVVSSTWRLDAHYFQYLLNQLDKALEQSTTDSDQLQMTCKTVVVGSTPRVSLPRALREDGTYGAVSGAVELQRIHEILAWLNEHGSTTSPRWAVLDDLGLEKVAKEHGDPELWARVSSRQGCWVRTDPEAGLTERNVQQVLTHFRLEEESA